MKLTPIRVRGKRGQPKPLKKSKRHGNDDAEVYGQPENKRARKHHGEGEGTRVMRRARLDQLPQEILERIFIASQNLFLPLVNRELYHMLSNDSVKYRLVGAAFAPTWDAYYGCDNFEVVSYDGWQSDVERIEGDPTFQSSVLACSWAKLPMLLSSFDVWIRQHSRGRVYFRIPELKQDRLKMFPQPGSLYERAYIDETDDDTSSIMTMREKLAFDLANFEALISYSSSAANTPPGQIPLRENMYPLRAMLGMHLEVHPGARIPLDLLSGPFESDDGAIDIGTEKMHRLFWLVRGGSCLQEDQTWEVTREGFKQIIRLIQTDAVKTATSADDAEDANEITKLMSAEADERMKLAARLLALFSLLGVFDPQLHWPRYIVQTSLAQVSALIPHAAPASRQEALLGEVAALLRQTLGPHGETVYRHLGRRWRLQGRYAMHSRAVHVAAFTELWRHRAGLFLGVPGGGQAPSPLMAPGNVGHGLVMHEPWSDFGLD
ncbi:hypothetical protein VM1G_10179 [Cytospora mali]|uniref:Uncharacterized protein n=1 Tax=Cytospora mali TaxID=578113 RepID=A0A194WEB7_CYTMA|nr:hypothetical protein VM1G_10179 [Valsa mali]